MSAVYELKMNNKVAIEITQHKNFLQKEKKYCFKIFATCHYFCHCISTDPNNTEMANKGEKIKNKILK